VQDFLELAAFLIVREHDAAHFLAIKRAIVCDDSCAKSRVNLIEGGHAGSHHLARDNVGIDDRHTQLFKVTCNQ
jgi:hypothetical protein